MEGRRWVRCRMSQHGRRPVVHAVEGIPLSSNRGLQRADRLMIISRRERFDARTARRDEAMALKVCAIR